MDRLDRRSNREVRELTNTDLRDFEDRVRVAFEAGEINGPVHLSGGNEQQLIDIFRNIKRTDYVFSTWRNHYHALLHGVPQDELFAAIKAGKSLSFNSAKHRFYTSAIVGGILPIAAGVAAAIKRRGTAERVWCFIGDMAASIGAFRDAQKIALYQRLDITFVIEDNGLSTETPTGESWGRCENHGTSKVLEYRYQRTVPHYGSGAVRNL